MARCFRLFIVAAACAAFLSCAGKPAPEDEPPELEFRPLMLRWKAVTPEDELHPDKDPCVIRITAALMRNSLVIKSEAPELEYLVVYGKKGEKLDFDGIATNPELSGKPEFHWTTTCGGDENVVVNFHNGQ